MEYIEMVKEISAHLREEIIPFWMGLMDKENGGYYGFLDYDLHLDKEAEKGCILNSRITWFFSNAYTLFKDPQYLSAATVGYRFLMEKCLDTENGGVYWSLDYKGNPLDTTKHTYNQAFAIYALSSYYEASKDGMALSTAKSLFDLIEKNCKDDYGYLEAFTRDFKPQSNEKLSENGIIAEKTMNTILHVMEGYTELYRVSKDPQVLEAILSILKIVHEKIYNPELKRLEVFFDREYKSLIDLHSYGHDIETAWLLDRTLKILGDDSLKLKFAPVIDGLTENIYLTAFDGHSLANECEKGLVNEHRVWWVQAEAIVGFVNGYERDITQVKYLEAAKSIWEFIKEYVCDKRPGSEWFWEVTKEGKPFYGRPIVEPWKCPYHNGRMCFELMKRNIGG
ncbi:MAG: AGE family epimerase/isomerase [Pseudobutyrivibrio sp.]|nr:AGE family epimerase/isomerase [Pseudobutyrivibrio sp.]